MGSLWIAQQESPPHEVVIKFHEHGFIGAQAETTLQRFLRESRLLARIQHHNVAQFYGSGTTGEHEPFLVMEYIVGETVRRRLMQDGVLELSVALCITSAIADGLSAAHEVGVLHRDVKPDNIMLDTRGDGLPVPKLLDFGLARPIAEGSPLTSEGRIAGTPGYMSREQGRGLRELDGRVDVYALGVTLYEMLSLQLPSEGKTGIDHVIFGAMRDPIPLSGQRPDLPAAVHAVVMKALAPERDERYPSAAAFRDALRALE